MHSVTTVLFTDIEGSTRLWADEPEWMPRALRRHDDLVHAAIDAHHGTVVKMTGDGVFAVFDDPRHAISATLQLQQALADPDPTNGIGLRIRCGVHVGVIERRGEDYFGSPVNRAARIMGIAHGGQVLLSQGVANLVRDRLPRDVSLRDLGSVRLRDLASSERIFQVVHPLLRQDFPALRSLESTPNNLPQQPTSFIGRERETVDVRKALGTARLLTLQGAGGIGKTRLSLQVAADVLEEYPDGVWFVELAQLKDERLVPQAVASVLGVKEEAGRPVTEALVKHVADRRLLLLLDNCEHVVQACAVLVNQLLRSGPELRILAASREPLRVSGEASFPVPPLAVPADQEPIAVEALSRYPAVSLFVDRATAALPPFRLTDHNAKAVVEICRRLDGIPLAIELAAARVRALSVENITARLSDRFHLLTGGARTALPRQQTLRALIDWSYDLLTAKERILFRRLAVFAGGWTLEAAEVVCLGGEVGEGESLDLLADLVDKSLVVVEAEGRRYRFLETVRQYAQERLTDSGDEGETRTRHLGFHLTLAEKARPELVGPTQETWLGRLDAERENLLSAHEWCDHAEGGAELGLKLASSLRRYWMIRGLLGLGHHVTVEALGRPGAEKSSLSRWEALFDAGQLGSWMGRYTEAQGYLEESLAFAREIGDKQRVAHVLQPLGLAFLGQGNLAAARQHFEEAIVLARELGNKRGYAAALNALAQLHRAEGELDTAEPLYRDVLALARELADRESIAIALLNLAMVSIARGFGERARAMLLEVWAIADEIGSAPLGQSAMDVCAGLASLSQEWGRAARFFGVVEAQTKRTGLRRDPADEAFLMPLIENARKALGAAAFSDAEASGRALRYEDATAEAHAWLENGS